MSPAGWNVILMSVMAANKPTPAQQRRLRRIREIKRTTKGGAVMPDTIGALAGLAAYCWAAWMLAVVFELAARVATGRRCKNHDEDICTNQH